MMLKTDFYHTCIYVILNLVHKLDTYVSQVEGFVHRL